MLVMMKQSLGFSDKPRKIRIDVAVMIFLVIFFQLPIDYVPIHEQCVFALSINLTKIFTFFLVQS